MKAVFLDRDGVLCKDTDYVTSLEKLEIFDYSKEAVSLIKDKGYLTIIITNQSAVARGMMTESELNIINEYIMRQTGVDAIYYCPHLPPEENEIQPYRINCNCRKPDTGLIEKAISQYKIDVRLSYMVGDRDTDIQTGKKAHLKTVYLESGHKSNDKIEWDFKFSNLIQFAKKI